MIPILLSLEGLYSYQQKQVIEFDPLTHAQLFGIFGATGSGKSSILEAITYALYGESERLNRQDSRAYNMMNLKSKRMHIEFVFESEGKQYKFVVSAKRNSRHFTKVESPSRSAYKKEQHEWQPISPDSAQEITGLSYKNFRRTIIIPQGKFQEFLQLTDTERTRMLKDIFYLDRYELAHKTAGLEQRNKEAMIKKQTQLAQLAHVTTEHIEEVKESLAHCSEKTEALRKELLFKQTIIQELEQVKELFQRLEEQQANLHRLQEKAATFAAREKQLHEYERCLIDFKPLLDKQQELSSQLDQQQTSYYQKQRELKQYEQTLQQSLHAFEEVEKQFHQREQLLQKAEEITHIHSLKELERILKDKSERIAKGETLSKHIRQEIETLSRQEQQLFEDIGQMQARQPALQQLLKIQEWFTEKKNLEKTLQRWQQEWELKEQKGTQLIQAKHELLGKTSLEPLQFDLSYAQLDQILEQSIQVQQIDLKEAEQHLQQAEIQAELSQLSQALEEGKPCPLCGSTHHPHPATIHESTDQLILLKENIHKGKSDIAILEKSKRDLIHLADKQATLDTDQQRLQQELLQQQQQLHHHQSTFSFEGYAPDHPEQFQDSLTLHQQLAHQIQNRQKELEQTRKARLEQEKTLETYSQRLSSLEQEKKDTEVAFQSGILKLTHITYADYTLFSKLQLEKEVSELKAAYEKVETLYQTYQHRVHHLRDRISHTKGEADVLHEHIQEYQKALARKQQEIHSKLANSTFEELPSVERILQLALHTGNEREAISQYKKEVNQVHGMVEELTKQVQHKVFDSDQYEHLSLEIEQLTEQQAALTKEIGGFERELAQLEEKYKEKVVLEKEMEQLEKRQLNIQTLKKLFARSGFVNYVSSVFLRQLCEAANHRFSKLTRNALRLEVTENNQFQVRDYLHEGQTRSVKTLSGGQTFQAALCLALALADQVQKQARSLQNFFFLDEGFGSQDKASLQVIFQTLSSLRKEHRIVGLISHVEELQQEIDTYLQVTLSPEQGSQLKGSWQ